MKKNEKIINDKGFSLVELIIVIAIMAILVGVLAPQFMKYIESSRQSTDIQSASAIRSAIEAGVTDGTVTGATVTVKFGTGKVITVDGTVGTALTDVGLSANTATKSDGWYESGTIATYDTSTYKWTAGTVSANSKTPNKDIKDAFK